MRAFQPPWVVGVSRQDRWSPSEELTLRLTVEAGAYLREVRLHYREADQNRDFRTTALVGGHSGEYVFQVDTRCLDDSYELIYYFEVVDVLGGGSFYPDPFREARYFVCRPE